MLNRYLVYTPEYPTYYIDEPPEYGADTIEILAWTKRDAIIMGTKEMLKSGHSKWCKDNRSSGLPPFAGVRAREIVDDTSDY